MNRERIPLGVMGVDALFCFIAVEDHGFYENAYCVSRLSTTLDEPPTGMRDVRFSRFVDTKPFREDSSGALSRQDIRNDKYLKEKELEDNDE